jgi:hypothetical protein
VIATTTTQQPPAPPEGREEWRGNVRLYDIDWLCAVTVLDGRPLPWKWYSSAREWGTVCDSHSTGKVLMAWALHERAVAAAERKLRLAERHSNHACASGDADDVLLTGHDEADARSELRRLGRDPDEAAAAPLPYISQLGLLPAGVNRAIDGFASVVDRSDSTADECVASRAALVNAIVDYAKNPEGDRA